MNSVPQRLFYLTAAVLMLALAACATPTKSGKRNKSLRKKKTVEVAVQSDRNVRGAARPQPPATTPPSPPEESQPPVEVAETTSIEPRLAYRASWMQTNPESVYWKDEEYTNSVDQLYATVRLARSYDYRHDVIIEPTFRTIRDNPSKMDAVVLEQAYIDSTLWQNLSLTAGKKTEYEGSGFMVNPSDLLNEDKDLFDPLYQQEGKVFTRLRYKMAESTLAVGYVPKRGADAKEGKGWLQLGSSILDADIKAQVMSHKTEKVTTGLSVSRYFGDRIELHGDGRYQARQRSQGELGEGWRRHSAYKFDDPSGYYLGGMRLVLTARRTLILEGIQQQSGLLPEEMEVYHQSLRTDKGDYGRVEPIPTRLQGRRYAFASYQDDDTIRATHFGASYLLNLSDQSYFASASLTYHLSPISSVEISSLFFQGREASEFGAMPFPQVTHLTVRGKF